MAEADAAMSVWNVTEKARKMKNFAVAITQKIPGIRSNQRRIFSEH